MRKYKIIPTIVLTSILALSCISFTYASDTAIGALEDTSETYTYGETYISRGEVLVWVYKTINGVEYKRRWSVTNNCWYDPGWIPV